MRISRAIMLATVLAGVPAAEAQGYRGGGGASSDAPFGMELSFENSEIQGSGVDYGTSGTAAGDQFRSLSSDIKGSRGLLNLYYRVPGGVRFSLFGGMSFGTEVEIANNLGSRPVLLNYDFDASPTYGFSIGFDVFPNSPVYFRPSLRGQRTTYSGTSGSTNSSACVYEYGSGANTAGSSCQTAFWTLPAGAPVNLASQLTETVFTARLELGWDVAGSGVIVFGGVEEIAHFVHLDSVYTLSSGATLRETLDFNTLNPHGAFFGASMQLMGLTFSAEYHGLAQHTVAGNVGLAF